MINNIGDLNYNNSTFFMGVTVKPRIETKEETSDLFVKSDCKINQEINELENIFSK